MTIRVSRATVIPGDFMGIRYRAPAAAAFTGALDATPGIVHLYCPARRWLSAYTGNLLRLRRDSDSAESDFGADSAGELNVAAIAAWLGAANGYVTTLYDQTGSDNIVQATADAQPLYVASAQNGHAGMSFNGTGQFLKGAFTTGGALSQPFSAYAVAQLDASVVNDGAYHSMTDGNDSTNRMLLGQTSAGTPDRWMVHAGAELNGGASNSNWRVWSVLFNGASSQFWHNGASIAAGNAGAQNPDGLTVGSRNTGSILWKGYICSVVVCDPSHTDAQRGVVESALNAYWAVY